MVAFFGETWGVDGLSLSPDGSRGAFANIDSNRFFIFDTDDGNYVAFPGPTSVDQTRFAGPAKVAAWSRYYQVVSIYNSQTGEFVGDLPGLAWSASFDTIGKFGIGSEVPWTTLIVWDVNSLTKLGTYTFGGWQGGFGSDISDDGRYISTGRSPGGWGVWRNPHFGIIGTPNAFSIFRGGLISGSLASLVNDDDSRLTVRPGPVFVNTQSPIHVIVDSTVPIGPVSSLRMLLDGRAASTSIEQRIEFYDFIAGAYQTVDLRQATTADSLAVANAGANPGRFVQAVTGKVRSRIRYKATGPIFQYPWTIGIDYVSWRLDR
ncbi:MAG: hypothetical protein H0W86_01555 [Armatimonadetes bacterium]|nr:hypothetical protein [Armatimonadota bacterium]